MCHQEFINNKLWNANILTLVGIIRIKINSRIFLDDNPTLWINQQDLVPLHYHQSLVKFLIWHFQNVGLIEGKHIQKRKVCVNKPQIIQELKHRITLKTTGKVVDEFLFRINELFSMTRRSHWKYSLIFSIFLLLIALLLINTNYKTKVFLQDCSH